VIVSERRFNPFEVDVPRALAAMGLDAEHKGDAWFIRCPSGRHEDRRPSYAIKDVPGEPKHGLGFCQACKFGGTMAELVSHVLKMTVPGAYGWLLERAMGRMLDIRVVNVNIVSPVPHQMVVPSGVTIAPMAEWPTPAARFALARGITPAQVDQWGLGYAVEGKLAHRIFIPVWGVDGELLHYTARTFIDSPCRYKSCTREEGFDDGAVFGEQAWPALQEVQMDDGVVWRRPGPVATFEGALNALAFQRAVPKMPFASLFGSNVNLKHVMKLATFERVVVLTDSDMAGDRAGEKLLGAFARHLTAVRARTPKGMDANDMERKDPAALRRLVEAACAA
jgi:hypothetical protein